MSVKVEILHIDDCPNWEEAGRRARTALGEAGVQGAELSFRLLYDTENGLAGLPTTEQLRLAVSAAAGTGSA